MKSTQLNKLIFLLGFLAFFTNGDNYAAAPLLIDIARDLRIEVSAAVLSVTAYMLCFGLLTIIFGPMGDRFGKARILKIAAFGTGIFSILCALANSLTTLVLLRGLNGAFAAGILPVTIALVGERSEPGERHNVIGKVMGLMFLGGAAATVIGGLLAYVGSWKLVYTVYGAAELLLALGLLGVSDSVSERVGKLNFVKVYREALANRALVKVIGLMFFVGFSVLGSFAFTGKLVENRTGFNILNVGLLLSLYGLGTIVGGRNAGSVRKKLGDKFLLIAGIIGSAALVMLALATNTILMGISLFAFGIAFIFLQSTLVTTAQELAPRLRGTVMSLASFSMVVSGALGTLMNSMLIRFGSMQAIFLVAAVMLFIVGILAAAVFGKSPEEKTKFVVPEESI